LSKLDQLAHLLINRIQNAFPGLSLEEAFTRNTDGENCPISRYYISETFCEICHNAGFEAEFLGGYFSKWELDLLKDIGKEAIADKRLADVHKDFLTSLTYSDEEYPLYKGKYAGIGGVYKLRRA